MKYLQTWPSGYQSLDMNDIEALVYSLLALTFNMNNCHQRRGNLHKEILKHDDSWYCYCTKKENTNSYRILNTFNQKVDAKFCWIMAQLKNCQCLCQTHDDDDDALIIFRVLYNKKVK